MIKERLKKERRRGDTVPLCFVCKETSISIYNFYANVDSLCIPPAYLESNSTVSIHRVDPPKQRKKERKKAKGNNKRNGRWKLDKLDLRDAFFSARVVHLSFSNPEGGMTLHECIIARP